MAEYCERVIRFVAAQMLDPHRYFEQKLLGQLSLSDSGPARARLLQQLVTWIAADELLTAAQRKQLDTELAARHWPTTTLAERNPALALLLLRDLDTAEARATLQQAIDDAALVGADRQLVQARLRRHGD